MKLENIMSKEKTYEEIIESLHIKGSKIEVELQVERLKNEKLRGELLLKDQEIYSQMSMVQEKHYEQIMALHQQEMELIRQHHENLENIATLK